MAYYGGALFGGGSDERRSNPFGTLAMMIIAPLAATLIQLSVSRSREYLADESGAHLLGDGDSLARALIKMRDFKNSHNITANPADQTTAHLMFVNMFNGGSVLSGLFSTHPDINERIKRLEQM
jgi:heat shock protein HtpX